MPLNYGLIKVATRSRAAIDPIKDDIITPAAKRVYLSNGFSVIDVFILVFCYCIVCGEAP